LQPPEAGSPQTDIGAEKAAPKPKPETEVSQPLKANSQELDQQMAEAHLTEEQLKKSNEPQFQEALGAKKEAQANAVEAPQAYRQEEKATLNKAQTEAQATSQTQLQGMHGEREQLLAQVMGAQSETQGKDTQERAKIAKEINGIYEKTKGEVETVLNGIDGEVTSKFDAGAATAKQKFETYVGQKMEAWEQQRYGEWYDVTGWDERVSDAWNGLPPEVNQFFVDGRQLYLNSMDVTLTGIANFVAQKLNEAKQKIAEGKQKIQEYVAGLPENLKQVGQEAAQNIQEKFNQLEESVNNKQDELIDSLAQKYSENLQQIDAEIEKKKEENRGLKDKAKDAIVGTYQTIMQLKDMLMGVLAKAAGAIDKIILDPIAFLGNLISGIKQGFDKFAGNIENHLQKGLLGWLTGAMAGAGITMPESFDLKGIFSLVMQVLGVVYDGIKSRVIKALGKNGEKMFTALESSFEMFVILKNEGIGGLWQFLQDKIGDLKVMVIDTIKTFVVENVIKAGVLWVVSLLNPASAFIKACKAIYDIIMFFIERGSQIAQLVNAVTDSVGAIASGAIGGAAALIENALGTSLPVVISFMASLLGLGGISEKIEGIIKKVRAPIDKAIDWLIAQAVKFAKKIGKALGFGKDEKGKDGKDNKEGKLEDTEVGKTINFSADGESHRLWINAQGTSVTVMVASEAGPVETKINQWQRQLDENKELLGDKRPQALSLLGTARQRLGITEQEGKEATQEMEQAKQNPTNEAKVAEAQQADNQTETAEQTLADVLQQLFELFGEDPGDLVRRAEILAEIAKVLPGRAKERSDFVHQNWEKSQIIPVEFGNPKRKMYQAGVLAGTDADAIASVNNPRLHESFYEPYFKGNKKKAASDEFAEFVFVKTDAPHSVRTDFLKKLGEPAAERLKSKGNEAVNTSDLADQQKAQVKSEIAKIQYDGSVQPLGKFINFPGSNEQVDSALKAAVGSGKEGILRFMEEMVTTNSSGGVTWSRFLELWDTTENRDFLKDKFRDADPGMHEWIPTNYIPKVLERAINVARPDKSNLAEALKWIKAHHLLRSPTNYVIYNVVSTSVVVDQKGEASRNATIDPSGHTGAFYNKADQKRPVLDFRQELLHNKLRTLFDEYAGSSARNFARVLRSQLSSLIWDGSLRGMPVSLLNQKIGVLWSDAGQKAELTLEDFAEEQAEHYQEIFQMFTKTIEQLA
jgi:hypothetical protein